MSRQSSGRFVQTSLFSFAIFAASCAESAPFIHQNIENQVALRNSAVHEFTYVNVTQEDGELVIFGKVKHHDAYCGTKGHVDVAIISDDDTVRNQAELALASRSKKMRGWHGAAFRARLPIIPTAKDKIRLTFHDDSCMAAEAVPRFCLSFGDRDIRR